MMLTKELYLEERRQEILRQVEQTGRVTVTELSRALGVSDVTIRTDLQALADRNLLIRTHGGAIPATGLAEFTLALRRQQQVQEKGRIGEAAAATISDGDSVFLDSSSTALTMVRHLRQRHYLTVMTNSLAVAQELRDVSRVTVVMPGGTLQYQTDSLVGTDGLGLLFDKYNIQTGFFGAHGLNLPEGLTDVSPDEAEVKQAVAARCRRMVVLLDATKWGRVGVASFARPDQIDMVVTDSDAPAELVEKVKALGIDVIRT